MKDFRNVLRRHFIEEFKNVYTYTWCNYFLGGWRAYFNKFIYTCMGLIVSVQTIPNTFNLRCLDLL